METKNHFYLYRAFSAFGHGSSSLYPGYSYDLATGEMLTDEANMGAVLKHSTEGANRVYLKVLLSSSRVLALKWGDEGEYLGYDVVRATASSTCEVDYAIPSGTAEIAFVLDYIHSTERVVDAEENLGFEVNPHYKQIKKQYKKETGQMFFRESLEGKITLFGKDYVVVGQASIEETIGFTVRRNGNVIASASFNKSDCAINKAKKSVELKLSYNDRYTKLLDAYDNTYDFIKAAPAITPLTLTKRCILQVYIKGENVVSNYSGGTQWETEVTEVVDSDSDLRGYHFAEGPILTEVTLSGFNFGINATFACDPFSTEWESKDITGVPCRIVFVFKKAKDTGAPSGRSVYKLTDPGAGATSNGSSGGYLLYDTYSIQVQAQILGDEYITLYESKNWYGRNMAAVDGSFRLVQGTGLYPMEAVTLPAEYHLQPSPASFYMGEQLVKYKIWARLLCDAATNSVEVEGETVTLYNLSSNDFAIQRNNYRKCTGYKIEDKDTSVVRVRINNSVSDNPGPYGTNDSGKYFVPPYNVTGQYFYPLSRSAWANASLWIRLGIMNLPNVYENYLSNFYREYTLKDTYHIGDAIKALLLKIDPTLKHEKTAEYSQFLYGHSGATASDLGNCELYITQKTNILKGEYDQAAQKAEITFKQLMEMLRDCFRCYWYVDEQNRFRIEHVSYFLNGLSYDAPGIQLDMTAKMDKFNKKPVLYYQRELSFDKTDLPSRYEFAWMDDATEAMGGGTVIDISNKYVKKDKTEDINIDGFSADVDYMLFLPEDFSNDGFALLMADSNHKVPIVHKELRDEKQKRNYYVHIQNWYASFNNLVNHYTLDMSGNRAFCNTLPDTGDVNLAVTHVKKCIKHNIEYFADTDINMYGLIKTTEGNGSMEEASVDIDTGTIEVELRYEPS